MPSRTKKRPSPCTVEGCGKIFSYPHHLTEHMRAVHLKLKRFKCSHPGCEYESFRKGDMRAHESVGHETGVVFHCPFTECAFATPSQQSLNGHMRTIHEQSAKSAEKSKNTIHPCTMEGCNKVFSSSSALLQHQRRIHLEERRYRCQFPECPYQSFMRAHVIRHEKAIHADVLEAMALSVKNEAKNPTSLLAKPPTRKSPRSPKPKPGFEHFKIRVKCLKNGSFQRLDELFPRNSLPEDKGVNNKEDEDQEEQMVASDAADEAKMLEPICEINLEDEEIIDESDRSSGPEPASNPIANEAKGTSEASLSRFGFKHGDDVLVRITGGRPINWAGTIGLILSVESHIPKDVSSTIYIAGQSTPLDLSSEHFELLEPHEGDMVKIVDTDSKFCGMKGTLVRIDRVKDGPSMAAIVISSDNDPNADSRSLIVSQLEHCAKICPDPDAFIAPLTFF